MIEDIQRERRNGSIAQYARNSEVNNAQAYQYGDQQPYQPLNNDFINFNNPPPVQRRSTINDMLVNFINGVQPVQQRLDHFGGLKRVSYNEEQVRLDYPECPI